MFVLTKQERTVLSLFVAVVCAGSIMDAAFKRYPDLRDIVNLIDNGRIVNKTDINRATFEELVDIPYIGEYTAGNIVLYRERHGPFAATEDIKNVKGIKRKNFERFRQHITVTKTVPDLVGR